MSRKRLIISILVVVAVVAAIAIRGFGGSSSIVIEGRIVGSRSSVIYLERHDGIKQGAIDTLELTERGNFKFRVDGVAADPTLYELRCGDECIPLLARGGDRIKINTLGSISLNYTVEGSEESELLRTFYQPYLNQANELRQIASEYAAKQRRGESTEELAHVYHKLYREIKQEQLRFIVVNKGSIAAIYALMQYLPGDSHLVSESSDLIYQRTVAEAVAQSYPNSQYLGYLKQVVANREAQIELEGKIGRLNYPEIEMSDRFGKQIKLSSLAGQVILLDFWAAESVESNQRNAELKEIYSKYNDQGFAVYQVGVENSKSRWISAIQTQRLPWISVSDLAGLGSSALRLYNISSIPANILISKSGEIVGRDLFGESLVSAVEREVKREWGAEVMNK